MRQAEKKKVIEALKIVRAECADCDDCTLCPFYTYSHECNLNHEPCSWRFCDEPSNVDRIFGDYAL